MKKLTIFALAIILPSQIMAMDGYDGYPALTALNSPSSSSSSSFSSPSAYSFSLYPDPNPAAWIVEKANPINPMTIPLQPESIAHVERCSRGTGLLGALFGGLATGSFVQRHYNHLSPLEKTGIILGGSTITAALSYLAAHEYTTGQTYEKQDEAIINARIARNNEACQKTGTVNEACQKTEVVDMDYENQRCELKYLLEQDQAKPANRIGVYNRFLDPKETKKYPISYAVGQWDNLAYSIQEEGAAVKRMGTDTPRFQSTLSPEKQIEIDDVMKQVRSTHKVISQLNSILSPAIIRNWTGVVKVLPEYTVDNTRSQLASNHTELKEREGQVQYQLARLAALQGCRFSQAYLTKTFAQHLWTSFTTDYPSTREGQAARARDIAGTKDNIGSLMQNYLIGTNTYTNRVNTYNRTISKVPETIKTFVETRGGTIDELDGYPVNEKLTDYNHYLNHNNGDIIFTWLQDCFSDN